MARHRRHDSRRQSKPLVDSRREYILIVCEGTKTEPQYFEELREKYQLDIVNIEITSANGTDPISVVHTAKSKQQNKKNTRKRPFDRIYCVFDRDEHTNFNDACRQLEGLKKHGFRATRSWPSFEFWLLLHFRYTRQPFQRDGRRTAAQNCENALKSEMSDYRKGKTGVFNQLFPQLEKANKNATRAREDAEKTGEDNPSTEVHELVGYLQNINPMLPE
uniref:RloB-like protein n=1 Tax=Candidatus Kentrum sp. MB TaxID=2138164 RepID=A0A450XPP8_9GAMM|nr:MAG: RloB-like protein [Candidatus Kentron sp. MB]VFK31237.1 MAG: RloB-like protein [Candidatus Kentron sp. MB]VFK75411.1 MAG: RloB-like protein [Candidatus Kentron sp. MB]